MVDLPITESRGAESKLTYILHVPWASLALLPEADSLVGGLRIAVAFRDDQGEDSPVRTIEQPITLPAKYHAAAQKESYRYTLDMYLKPGRWTISLAVTDVVSEKTSFLLRNQRVSRP